MKNACRKLCHHLWPGIVSGFILSIGFFPSAIAENQTTTTSPIQFTHSLPYRVEIRDYDFGSAQIPTLHSYVVAEHRGLWVLLAGRTNGLHGFEQGGRNNFPPEFQNREVWILDVENKRSWHRSLEDAAAELTVDQVDALTATNQQFVQMGDRLYVGGGYGFRRDIGGFGTFDTLSAVDLPGIVDWVQAQTGSARDHIRQIHDPIFQVTGGAMANLAGRTLLVFGQDFEGGYNPFRNGTYTRQLRGFTIVDDGATLSIDNPQRTEPLPEFRRRDLNVVPRIHRDEATGNLVQGLVALSGVFTETGGAWTVPVEIDAHGNTFMADPDHPATFRQAFNAYESARVGLFSEGQNRMHTLLFGGIGVQTVDTQSHQVVTDNALPFVNDVTALVIDAAGEYSHYWLGELPEHYDEDGHRLRYGANAQFLLADGIPTYENGVLMLDELPSEATIGYILGGIVSNAPHTRGVPGAITAASNRMFAVVMIRVPEPGTLWLLVAAAFALLLRTFSFRRKALRSPRQAEC